VEKTGRKLGGNKGEGEMGKEGKRKGEKAKGGEIGSERRGRVHFIDFFI
jgi:hypothetical protein